MTTEAQHQHRHRHYHRHHYDSSSWSPRHGSHHYTQDLYGHYDSREQVEYKESASRESLEYQDETYDDEESVYQDEYEDTSLLPRRINTHHKQHQLSRNSLRQPYHEILRPSRYSSHNRYRYRNENQESKRYLQTKLIPWHGPLFYEQIRKPYHRDGYESEESEDDYVNKDYEEILRWLNMTSKRQLVDHKSTRRDQYWYDYEDEESKRHQKSSRDRYKLKSQQNQRRSDYDVYDDEEVNMNDDFDEKRVEDEDAAKRYEEIIRILTRPDETPPKKTPVKRQHWNSKSQTQMKRRPNNARYDWKILSRVTTDEAKGEKKIKQEYKGYGPDKKDEEDSEIQADGYGVS